VYAEYTNKMNHEKNFTFSKNQDTNDPTFFINNNIKSIHKEIIDFNSNYPKCRSKSFSNEYNSNNCSINKQNNLNISNVLSLLDKSSFNRSYSCTRKVNKKLNKSELIISANSLFNDSTSFDPKILNMYESMGGMRSKILSTILNIMNN
jgi:hypothetical protein